jgi:hypothetical protein
MENSSVHIISAVSSPRISYMIMGVPKPDKWKNGKVILIFHIYWKNCHACCLQVLIVISSGRGWSADFRFSRFISEIFWTMYHINLRFFTEHTIKDIWPSYKALSTHRNNQRSQARCEFFHLIKINCQACDSWRDSVYDEWKQLLRVSFSLLI